MVLIKNLIDKYPLRLFFILVFIVSWGVIFFIAGPDGFPVTAEQSMTLGMAILLGPSLTSILLTGLSGGLSGYRTLVSLFIKWRVGVRWYAIALLIAPISTFFVVGVLSIHSSEFNPSVFQSDDKASILLLAITGGVVVAIFEELGWTGFSIPRLLMSKSVFKSGVIVGLIWGLWHFPLFWEIESFKSFLPCTLLFAKLFSWLPPYRILMVWVFEQTESMFVTILMHVSLVATLLTLDPSLKGVELLIFILVRAIMFWSIAIVVLRTRNMRA